MNPIVTLASLFGLMTLLSASVLYFSFKGKIDASGKYFLAAEILMLLTLMQVIGTNLMHDARLPIVFFMGTLFLTASDIAVLFSIVSLTRTVKFRIYLLAILATASYSLLIEYVRLNIDAALPALMTPLPSGIIALATYLVCKNSPNQDLQSNTFLRWIAYAEITLFLLTITRVISYFFGSPVLPREASTFAILVYVVFSATCIFRYIAYQSLRISWIHSDGDPINPLNKNLAKAVQEKNKLLEGLISSNRKIGISALASSLAHQLSQPITGLSFQIHTAKHDLIHLSEAQNSVQILNKAGVELEKLTGLVSGLRRLFGYQDTQFDEIDLVKTCDTVIEFIEPTLKSNQINLVKNYSNNPLIIGNSIQLQQVIINLFNNAIYAINSANSKERLISIDISQSNDFAKIQIQDSGFGIDANSLSEIFELYRTTKKEGLGVGLWLSKTIIEKHAGSIKAQNATDSGAIFEIQIPLAKNSQAIRKS